MGKNLIYLFGKAKDNSQILFEDSTIHKEEGTLLTGYSLKTAPDDMSLDIIFRNSTVNRELEVNENINPEQIRITYE